MEKAFATAKPEFKDLSTEVLSALRAQDYSKAYFALQGLASQTGLNKEQRSVSSRGLLTLNGLLQTAQTKGDDKAAETLEAIRRNK